MKVKHSHGISPPENGVTFSGDFKVPRKLTSNIWNTLLVTWITPLLKLGGRRPLDVLDLGPVPQSFEAAPLTDQLSSAFKIQSEKCSNLKESKQKPNILLRALISVFGTTFLLEALFLIGEFTNMLPPLILKSLIDFKKDGKVPSLFQRFVEPNNYFIFASLLMFGIQVFTIFSLNTYFMISRYMGIKMRTSVSGLVYQKSLNLSCAARQVLIFLFLFYLTSVRNILPEKSSI